MNDDVRATNPKEFLITKIKENLESYGTAIIKAILFKENNSTYLYLADVNFTHKDEQPPTEIHLDYGHVVLVTHQLKKEDVFNFIESLSKGIISIGNIKEIVLNGGFNQSCYHISSYTKYAGVSNAWPFWLIIYSASSNQNVHFGRVYTPLVHPGYPLYPDFFEAIRSFSERRESNVNTPIGIDFIIPDYGARIKLLEIAEKQVTAIVEPKEIKKNTLIVQIYCKKGEKESYSSPDIELSKENTAIATIPFVPDYVYSYLIDKTTGNIIDSKSYGGYLSDRTDKVIIKTSKETIANMLANRESQFVEFKLDLDKEKNEFLESIVSFANTNNGTILLGVDDEGRIIGYYDDFEKTEKKIHGLVNGNCEPDIELNVEEIKMDGRIVIVINVKEGNNKPYLLAGRSAYKRVGKDDLVFTRLDFENVYSEKKSRYARIAGDTI